MNALPKEKIAIREYESEKARSDLSEITVIDSVANYFKHQHEWPQKWDESQAKNTQRYTIRNAKAIGMSPNNSTTENMEIALRDIGLYGIGKYEGAGDLRSIVDKVQTWRERLAKRLVNQPEIARELGL